MESLPRSFATFTAASIPDRISQRHQCCYIINKDLHLACRYPAVAPLEGLPLLQQKPQNHGFGAILHIWDLANYSAWLLSEILASGQKSISGWKSIASIVASNIATVRVSYGLNMCLSPLTGSLMVTVCCFFKWSECYTEHPWHAVALFHLKTGESTNSWFTVWYWTTSQHASRHT